MLTERGLACWWVPYGDREARYYLDWVNPFNSETSQCVTVPAGNLGTGIAQPIYLPVRRDTVAARPGAFGSDVDDVRALFEHAFGVFNRIGRQKETPPVAETVRRDVQDSHYDGPVRVMGVQDVVYGLRHGGEE